MAYASTQPVNFETKSNILCIKHDGVSLPVSLTCPQFVLDGLTVGAGIAPTGVKGDIVSGRPVEVRFAPIVFSDSRLEVKLHIQWSAKEKVLRKWASYRLNGAPLLLKRVLLEVADAATMDKLSGDGIQSRPVFLKGFFAGIEFPVAIAKLDGGNLTLGHQPGLRMQPGVWYETRKAVYGIAPNGREREAFQTYISANRPGPKGFHLNYNSWWTCPLPYSEDDILKLMKTFDEKLYKPYGVSFDTFCIDLGWSDPNSLWDINRKLFPDGFAKIQEASARMNSHLGLWVSPSNRYSPDSLDNEWARENGYEVANPQGNKTRYLCLAGKRYQEGLKGRLVEMAVKYGVRHFKFDGYLFQCLESDHGHEPGILSAEAVADGVIGISKAIRKAAPNAWIESTCFGWNPSPWWLFNMNSVIGTYGDDYPPGRVPAPVYHESGTTARDYFNLQGSALLPIPVTAQEVLGIVVQSKDPFLNDGVMVVMRGNMFLPVYLNPAYMDDSRWRMLADLLKWAKKNSSALRETVPLLPVSWQNGKCPKITEEPAMPREPYGYAHLSKDHGLVAVRNPWIAPQTYSLKLDGNVGLSPEASGLTAVSLYPEPRLYGRGIKFGDTLNIPLAPYETVVLSIRPRQSGKNLPNVEDVLKGQVIAADLISDVSSTGLKFQGKVEVISPQAELLILLEGNDSQKTPTCTIKVNGNEVQPTISNSDAGWTATQMKAAEHWLFIRVPLTKGSNSISAELIAGDKTKISAWVWATRPGKSERSGYPNSLPEPELVSLDAVSLLDTSK